MLVIILSQLSGSEKLNLHIFPVQLAMRTTCFSSSMVQFLRSSPSLVLPPGVNLIKHFQSFLHYKITTTGATNFVTCRKWTGF
jgi:hypothetical protein